MPKLSFTITGLDALIRAVGDLEPKVLRPAVRKGIDDATKLILWSARANLKANGSVDTRTLYESLGRRVVTSRDGKAVVGIVGPRVDSPPRTTKAGRAVKGKAFNRTVTRRGAKKSRLAVPAWYIRFVEFGTAPHGVKRSLRPGGKLHPGGRPRPFLRPAYEANRAVALSLIRKRIAEAIRKANSR